MGGDDARAAPRVVTFGCRLNIYESEAMRAQATAAGLSDAVIVNTCAVTAEAVRQSRQAIRRLRRENPEATLVVTGCAAQIEPETFAAMGEVDAVLGNAEKMAPDQWAGLAAPDFGIAASERVRVNDIMAVRETAPHLIDGYRDHARAYVQVQNGCDHRCTFCVIPYGRGNSRSVPMGEVCAQVERLTGAGYREIVLTGVDLTSYGPDLPGAPSLGDLVQKILSRAGAPERLRLSSIDSIEADDALVEAVTGDARVMPHLHLSLQHGDNLILKRMKRRHRREDAIRFCAAMRARRPEIVFGADLIAGFPTETNAMAGNSRLLIDDCGLTWLHIFPYSARKGTPAARMPQVPVPVRKERAAVLREVGGARVASYLAEQVGRRHRVLAETSTAGRTEGFAPVRFTAPQVAGSVVELTVRGVEDGRLVC